MNTTRTFARRRWLALMASIAVVLGIVGGAIGGAPEPAAAADPVPIIHGAFVGDRHLPSTGGTRTYRITYQNLTPGPYRVFVYLTDSDGDKGPDTRPVHFSASSSSGTVDSVLTVPDGYAGRTLFAAAILFNSKGDPIGGYNDPTDPLQTLIVSDAPSIYGTIVGERWKPASGWVITEQVSFQNLTPGAAYGMTVRMMNSDGKETDAVGSMKFTPTSPSGTVDVEVIVSSAYAGRTLSATAYLFDSTAPLPIATHVGAGDPQQTLIVRSPPAIRSSLTDRSDGDRELSVSGGDLIDVVSYENLDLGTTYTITGTLMRASDATATPLTSGATFTPTESNGTVELPYTVPAGYAGESLVTFDRLYADTDTSIEPIAEDTEIDDPTQTVTVARADAPVAAIAAPKLAATGLDPSAPLGLAAAALAAGALLLLRRRRASAPVE